MDKDVNYLSYSDVSGETVRDLSLTLTEEEKGKYDDTLKLSHVHDFKIYRASVTGGKENAIDMNRECKNILIQAAILFGGGHCPVVIKGGCEDIHLDSFDIFHDGPYEIELGGWSDQSRKRTRRVTIENSYRIDGNNATAPIRVVCGNADRPTIIGGNVKILFWRSLALKLFVFFKGLFK